MKYLPFPRDRRGVEPRCFLSLAHSLYLYDGVGRGVSAGYWGLLDLNNQSDNTNHISTNTLQSNVNHWGSAEVIHTCLSSHCHGLSVGCARSGRTPGVTGQETGFPSESALCCYIHCHLHPSWSVMEWPNLCGHMKHAWPMISPNRTSWLTHL